MNNKKKNGLTTEQQLKLDSVKNTFSVIIEEAEKHIKSEPKILALNDYQIIYGIAHVKFEDQIFQEIEELGSAEIPNMTGKSPTVIKQVVTNNSSIFISPEEEFETTKNDNSKKNRKVFH